MKQKTKIIIFVCAILILIGLIILSSLLPRAKNKNKTNTTSNTSSPINNGTSTNEDDLYVKITYDATSEVYKFEGTDKTITVYQDYPTVVAENENVKNKIQADLGKIASDEFNEYKKQVQSRIDAKYGIDAAYMEGVGNLTLKWTFSNSRNDKKVISVANTSSGSLGGVSWDDRRGYSYSAETGDRITINDIAVNPDALKKYVNQETVKYLRQNYQKLGVYPNILNSLSDKINIDNMSWYLSNSGLTICFSKDAVSPNSFDFTIYYQDLNDLIKSEYLK